MFTDRFEAGKLLGKQLTASSKATNLVIGIAHGGAVVASGVSKVIQKPFDVLVVKKIGSPGNPELATGAIVPDRQSLDVRGKIIILTDDGAATGATIAAAIRWVRDHGVKKIIVALPVAPPDVVHTLQSLADKVIVLEKPDNFESVGQFYRDFTQVSDGDVVQLLS